MLAGVSLFPLSSAVAADLPPIYATPAYETAIYDTAPELQPVEIGNGWYLRGDVGYGFNGDLDASYRERRPDFVRYPNGFRDGFSRFQYDSFDAGHDGFRLDDNAEFGVGMGYQFTNWLRGDLTARYYKLDVSGHDRTEACFDGAAAQAKFFNTEFNPALLDCGSEFSSDADAIELMANAYVDLGTIAGFTPYVGGGVGAVQVRYDDFVGSSVCSYDGGACVPNLYTYNARYEGGDDWRFAYSLMAGISYDISENLKLDAGYRYTDIAGGTMFESTNPGVVGSSAEDDGFARHTIQAGVRYSLW
ncbi:porin family protein [Fulvimarina endophytica]|uniref:Porin family protein n=2 Tax=Fulvimarina endophytica TaxID=2293836 RepID=A0A371XBB8_9HYPH|nr:porin family protein [Fulvimarina endophytica]